MRDRRKTPVGWDEAVDLWADPALVPDIAEVEVPEALRASIVAAMGRYPDRHSATLPALAAAQKVHGWCSPQAMLQVAAVMQVTPAYLSSVATFYDMLRTEPIGDLSGEAAGSAGCARPTYVYVCTSVACHLRNAKGVYDAIADEARDQELKNVDLREFECLGACDMAPMASVDGRYVGPLDEEDAHEFVAALKDGREVLPGRGLTDEGYALPWETRAGPPAPPDPSPA